MPASNASDEPDTGRPARDASAPRHLIVTLFALYGRTAGNWLSVASIVALMAELGVAEPSVRSSISRLKRRGILTSSAREGAAGYSLARSILETIDDGDLRIFTDTRPASAGEWLLAVFSVPETERDKRHRLRTALSRMGFGIAAPGVWIAPAQLQKETESMLARDELSQYVELIVGRRVGAGELRTQVARWWDLDELAEQYNNFLAEYRPVLDELNASTPAPDAAFGKYVPLVTMWRRLPYLDPGLPLDALPPNWPGQSAREVFDDLNSALAQLARAHADSVLTPGGAGAPE